MPCSISRLCVFENEPAGIHHERKMESKMARAERNIVDIGGVTGWVIHKAL